MKKLTLEIYQSAKGKNGIAWAGKELPKNTKAKTLWLCPEGHIWEAAYNDVIVKGNGCRYCYGYKTIEDYQNFSRNGIKWAGTELPQTSRTNTLWRCPKGHTWETNWNNIVYKKSGCPYCPRPFKRPERDYKDAYKLTKMKWIGDNLPKNVDTKTLWLCPEGHTFSNTYCAIVYNRVNCPHCPKSFAKTIEDYRKIQGKDGTKWIGKKLPKTVIHHTKWTCSAGHIWSTSYKSVVYQNSGCPICQASAGEYAIKRILDSFGIKYIPQKTFPNCRNQKVLPFDFYFSVDNIEFLVEYDGLHHYRSIKFFGGEIGFQERLTNDQIKTKFAKDNGFVLIRIPYTDFDNIETIIETEIQKYT